MKSEGPHGRHRAAPPSICPQLPDRQVWSNRSAAPGAQGPWCPRRQSSRLSHALTRDTQNTMQSVSTSYSLKLYWNYWHYATPAGALCHQLTQDVQRVPYEAGQVTTAKNFILSSLLGLLVDFSISPQNDFHYQEQLFSSKSGIYLIC